ncbi:balbiani ring protein 3-like [Ambystoma mexicanum]|uniref:balbiani ring protein 3-like n=1 Tax=Ambystoma mexicanum TaxID=8296 RepID=UPI0037E7AE7D
MKASTGSPFLLAVFLLCEVHCALGDITPDKKGSCPLSPSSINCTALEKKPVPQCSSDQQCPGKLKCCEYNCSMQCKMAVTDKVGSCPHYDQSLSKCTGPVLDECQNDSECPGAERCCCRDCKRACTKTVKVGKCPPLLDGCKSYFSTECMDDEDCPLWKKCCSQCGKKCMDPERENLGYCPFDPEIKTHCGHLPPPRCSRDADCKNNEKCCRFGCGMQCVKALAEKPGTCPNVQEKCLAPLDEPKCRSDQDCLENKKCCNLCGNKCVDPEPERPGFCPSHEPVVCNASYTLDCSHDRQCQAREKCCDVGCRRTCVKWIREKSGVCPLIAIHNLSEDACNKCNDDKDCPREEKCCPGVKGRVCRPAEHEDDIVKPGECPVLYRECDLPPPYLHQCDRDLDCPGPQKCCVNDCHRECRRPWPAKGKPGICEPSGLRCRYSEEDHCQTDKDCSGDLKCCRYRCDLRCMRPLRANNFGCPKANETCITKWWFLTCKSDQDCPGYERCCNSHCTEPCK